MQKPSLQMILFVLQKWKTAMVLSKSLTLLTSDVQKRVDKYLSLSLWPFSGHQTWMG